MSSYWDNKWANANENWEKKAALSDNSAEILAGLKQSPGGLGKASPKKVRQVLDVGFNVGRSVVVTGLPGNLASSTPLLEIKGDDEKAQSIAITIQVEDIVGGSQIDKFIIIEWGSGGYQTRAEFDISQGIIVNINCSWARVTAVLVATTTTARVKFGAFSAYANGGIIRNNQRTARLDIDGDAIVSLAPAALSEFIPIPRFAKEVLMVGTPGGTNALDYSLQFFQGIGLLHEAWFITGDDNPGYNASIPTNFENLADRIKIVNRDAVDTLFTPRLIFGLSI